jgi:hypothetical protein
MSAEDYARNVERVEQARRLIDLLELAYRAEAFDLAPTIERQLARLLGLNAPTRVEMPTGDEFLRRYYTPGLIGRTS